MVPSWGAAVLRPYMNVALRELRRVMDRAKVLGKARDLENDRGYRVAGIHRADMGRSGLRPYTCTSVCWLPAIEGGVNPAPTEPGEMRPWKKKKAELGRGARWGAAVLRPYMIAMEAIRRGGRRRGRRWRRGERASSWPGTR